MKARIVAVLLVLPLLVMANNTTPVINAINTGAAIPTQAQLGGNAYVYVGVTNIWNVSARVDGVAAGGNAGGYFDWGTTYTTHQSPITAWGSIPQLIIDSESGPVPDVNNSPVYTVYFHYGTPRCLTNAQVHVQTTWTNDVQLSFFYAGGQLADRYTTTGPLDFIRTFSNLDCSNAPVSVTYSNIGPCFSNFVWSATNNTAYWRIYAVAHPSQNGVTPTSQPNSQQLIAPGSAYSFSMQVPCGQPVPTDTLWDSAGNGDDSVHDTGQQANGSPGNYNNGGGGSSTNGTGGLTTPPVTNTPPQIAQPTNSPLPAVGPTNVMLNYGTPTNVDLGSLPAIMTNAANAAASSAATAANQAHSDASGIANAINQNTAQSVSNAVAATQNGATNAAQGHQDAQATQGAVGAAGNMGAAATAAGAQGTQDAIKDSTKTITNSMAMLWTNYALETTQDKVLNTEVGISNMLSKFPTNGNSPGQWPTNYLVDSNALFGQIMAGTNKGAAVGAKVVFDSLSQVTTINEESGGSAATTTIDWGNGITFSIGGVLPDSWIACRNFITWFVYFVVFVAAWRDFHKTVMDSLKVDQARTAGTEILGTNANTVGAIAMAGIIVGLIAAITVAAVPIIMTFVVHWFGVSPFTGMFGWAYDFIAQVVPIGTLISGAIVIACVRVVFNFAGEVVGGIVKMLVGI